MSVLSLLLATAAFALLGLATDAHHHGKFAAYPTARRRWMLRLGGWLALITSVPPAMLAQGWIFGPILWAGAIMVGGGIAFLTLNLIPTRDTRR